MLLTTFSSTNTITTTTTATLFTLILLLLHFHHLSATSHRRLLHHSFFPLPPSPSQSPSLPPSSPPSSSTISDFSGSSNPNNYPFFPTYPTTPPPQSTTPTTTGTALPTFPANISSLALPSTPSPPSHSPLSSKLIIIIVLLSLLTLSLIISLSLLLLRRHNNHHLNTLHYSPSQKPLSPPPPPPQPSKPLSHTSSDFLINSRDFLPTTSTTTVEPPSSSEFYLKLCGDDSPELRPLPPLPKTANTTATSSQQHLHVTFDNNITHITFNNDNNEDFYSSTSQDNDDNHHHFDAFGLNLSPTRSDPDFPASDSDVSIEIQTLAARTTPHFAPTGRVLTSAVKNAGPPAPPPPAGMGGPPPLVPPSGPVVFKSSSGNLGEKRKSGERKETSNSNSNSNSNGNSNGNNSVIMKPKLKALHWDKVRAGSDRVMVWDHLHPGSFQLNEEMIETLFKANGPSLAAKDGPRRSLIPLLDEEYRVLDPKKSQNIAILLKALNVTEQEVCEALLEGNADALGTELLESLLKMAPTNEEERKLREYHDESPLKLGPAEKFLKAVLDHVPFAFKRVDAMLYITTFDSDVEYIRKSFETLEAACAELRNSRMFLKLLEAVLKTGNRMNVGTNRGDAHAFKLDTLLKLIDVKGTDGKTTLLHFVVQEIIKYEGSRLSCSKNNTTAEKTNPQPSLQNDIELRKRGLEVVSGLGGELMNVKKAAAMDSNSLSMEVAKLARGIIRVNEVLQLDEQSGLVESKKKFSESMISFLKKAEIEIVRIQSQESNTLSSVKELTEYFHGNSSEEKAHPLRIFTVVRDFLGVLDQVCKEVGKVNERTIISSAHPHPTSLNPSTPPPFPQFSRDQGDSSSDNESFSEK